MSTPKMCAMCGRPIGPDREPWDDYCSTTCWIEHHDADEREPEDLE